MVYESPVDKLEDLVVRIVVKYSVDKAQISVVATRSHIKWAQARFRQIGS